MKVDVIINVYGKPWQTLCSLKLLMKHSGEHIDKIYFIEEKEQPYNDDLSWVVKEFDNLIHFIPQKYAFIGRKNSFGDLNIPENRYNFRYQYGIENSDKKYVFVMHNDMLFYGDIIGDMLNEIEGAAGIGMLSQCWNCPANFANKCNRDKYYEYNPTYNEIISLCNSFPPVRGDQFTSMIDKNTPMPLPECRLNEFASLIDREVCIKECPPHSNSSLFGSYDGIDMGTVWFRDLVLKGYNFKHYELNRTSEHAYYSIQAMNGLNSGYQVQLNNDMYKTVEMFAKKYYEDNLKNI